MPGLKSFIARCEAAAVPDDEIDLSDSPELSESDFARGRFKNWRPVKKLVTCRIDADNLAWLQSCGAKGYQTRMNEALRWARRNGCPLAPPR